MKTEGLNFLEDNFFYIKKIFRNPGCASSLRNKHAFRGRLNLILLVRVEMSSLKTLLDFKNILMKVRKRTCKFNAENVNCYEFGTLMSEMEGSDGPQ